MTAPSLSVVPEPEVADGSFAAPACEAAVLGIALIPAEEAHRDELLARATAEAFTDPVTRAIFRAIAARVEREAEVDGATVLEDLRAQGILSGPEGFDTIIGLQDAASRASFRANLQELLDRRERRIRENHARDTLRDIADLAVSIDELRERDEARHAAVAKPARSRGPEILTLAELAADPSMLAPPEVVVPRIAWRGRTTLFAAREKLGKSTLARAAAAAVTRGRKFLDRWAPEGEVLWFALEEHPSDVARGFSQVDADPARVHVVTRLAGSFDDYRAAIAAVRPRLAVLDTLTAFVRFLGDRDRPESEGDNLRWAAVVQRLVEPAHEFDAGVLLLHHGRREDGRYRGATAIGGEVDVILEMDEGADPGERKIRAVGRFPMESFAVRRTGSEFELAGGELAVDARVLVHVSRSPRCSQREVESSVTGRAKDIREAVERLLAAGTLVDEGAGATGRKLVLASN
ncbi:MAG TPA: AAA family ATPase [Longimicrobiales bacterium]|nr:AAA family ATPase [Longimicrobiales bacterium]